MYIEKYTKPNRPVNYHKANTTFQVMICIAGTPEAPSPSLLPPFLSGWTPFLSPGDRFPW